MAEPAPLRPVPDPPKTTDCDEPGCGRSFVGEHGLQVHKARSHKKPAGTRQRAEQPKRDRPKLDTASVRRSTEQPDDDGYDPWIVLVGTIAGDDTPPQVATCVVSTSTDAQQVAELLTTLGHKPRRFRLNDAQEG